MGRETYIKTRTTFILIYFNLDSIFFSVQKMRGKKGIGPGIGREMVKRKRYNHDSNKKLEK